MDDMKLYGLTALALSIRPVPVLALPDGLYGPGGARIDGDDGPFFGASGACGADGDDGGDRSPCGSLSHARPQQVVHVKDADGTGILHDD